MKLPAIENYFYFRHTLKRLSKKGYGELSEVNINLIYSIHCMNKNGLLCSKKALYEFMCSNCHSPHKTKFFTLISLLVTKGFLKLKVTKSYKVLSLSMDGVLLLNQINNNLILVGE